MYENFEYRHFEQIFTNGTSHKMVKNLNSFLQPSFSVTWKDRSQNYEEIESAKALLTQHWGNPLNSAKLNSENLKMVQI